MSILQRRMARKLRKRGKEAQEEAQSGRRRQPEPAPAESDTDSDLYSEPATPDSSDSSEPECKLRLEFTVSEAQNFIVSKLDENQVLKSYLRKLNEWDRIDGPNVKREVRAAALCIVRETGWQGIFQARKEEIRAVDILRLSRRE